MKKIMMKKSILFFTGICVLLFAYIISKFFSFNSNLEKTFTEKTNKHLVEDARYLATAIDGKIEETLASLNISAEYLSKHLEKETAIQEYLEQFNRQYNFYKSYIIFPDGSVISNGSSYNLSESEFENYKDLFSGKAKYKLQDASYALDLHSLAFTVPVLKDNKVIALLSVDYTYNEFPNFFHGNFWDTQGFYYITKQNGEIVSTSNNWVKITKQDSSNFLSYLKTDAVNTTNYKDLERAVLAKTSGIVKVTFNNQSYLLVHMPLKYNNWHIFILASTASIQNFNNEILNGIFSLIFLVLILFCLFTFTIIYLQKKSKKMLEHLAYYDELTGLPNKTFFKKQAQAILAKTTDNYAYVILDLDKFKIINDKWGFVHGDNLLRYIAVILKRKLQIEEISCRATADIFHLLIKVTSNEELLKRLADISKEIRSYQFSENVLYNLNVYAGIYLVDNVKLSLDIAGDNALLAREQAKSKKNKFYAIYNEKLRNQIIYNQDLENIMQESLNNNEFEVYLQPKYELEHFTIVGAEALVRWNHPLKGMIFPDKFIPLFEKNGFIIELDNYVLEKVAAWLAQRLNNKQEVLPISVNQSRLHLYDADYLKTLSAILAKYNLAPTLIELELTETVFFENAPKMKNLFYKLHEQGFKISLDDFGTGYSSLNMLGGVLIDVLKLDREFFNENYNQKNGRLIIEAIIALAKKINMAVVAEGVETLEQVEFLKSINCDLIQGYYFSKPLTIKEFEMRFDKD